MNFTDLYLVISTVLLIILLFQVRKLKNNSTSYQHVLMWILFILVTQVIAITFFPLPIPSRLADVTPYVTGAQVNPGEQISNALGIIFNPNAIPYARITNVIQLVGNLLLLVPLCLALIVIYFPGRKAFLAVIACMFVSLLIEVSQHFVNLVINAQWRIADIDDIILNCLGVIIIGIIYYLSYRKTAR